MNAARHLVAAGILALFGLALPTACSNRVAPYPNRPITIVAPFTAGGAADQAARALASAAARYIGQSVVVVNRAGSNGVVGSDFVKNARPDGYTLLMSRISSQVLIPAVESKTPYTWDQFTILTLHERNPYVFAVKADSPHTTFKALVDVLKSKPGSVSYSTSGPATLQNFGPHMLFDLLGVGPKAAVMVPFQGGAEATTALVGGHVDFIATNLSEIFNQIRNKQARALAVSSPERATLIPDVPTVRELGYPTLEQLVGWSALVGPPDLPADVVGVWAGVLPRIAADPEWRSMLERNGSTPAIRTADESRAFIGEEYRFYLDLVQKLGLVR